MRQDRLMADAPEHPIFARFYDRMFDSIEKAGLAEMRAELLSEARGRTLELGAGTGLNLPHYTDSVTALVLTEPDPHMATRLRARLQREGAPAGIDAGVDEASAEELPYDDGSFDTVVSTLVLCTVPDPARALAEVRRVLAPGGLLIFVEHVRAEGGVRAWMQDRLERPWGFFAGGCHPNRPTGELLGDAGLRVERLDRGALPKAGPLIKPLVTGVATRP